MSDFQRPPLDRRVYDLIEIALYQVDKKHWAMLESMQVQPQPEPFTSLPPPKSPTVLLNRLEFYAGDLFKTEADQYGQFKTDRNYSTWLVNLVERVIARVFKTIDIIERANAPKTAAYHSLTDDEIRAGLRRFLLEITNGYIRQATAPPVLSPSPEAPVDVAGNVKDAPSENRERVEQFILRMSRSGLKIKRKDIWRAAGYKDRTEFERFQRGDSRNRAALTAFNRILNLAPEDFRQIMTQNL